VVNGGDSGVPDRGAEPNTGDAPPEGVVVEDIGVSVGWQWEESSSKGTFRGKIRLYVGMCLCRGWGGRVSMA